MALSSPSGALARVSLLPDYSLQQDATLKAVSQVVKNNQQMALQQAKLAARLAGGGGGGNGLSAKDGAWEWELDPNTPSGVRQIFVPGKTEKERARNKALFQTAQFNKTFQNDPTVQEKLAGLSGKSIDAQAKTIEDIRKNDLPRLFGDDRQAQRAIESVLKPQIDRINEGRKAIKEEGMLSTLWDSLRIGTKKTLTGLQEIGEDEQTKRQLNAELQAEVQNIVDRNPYLKEQRLREQEGQGFWERSEGVGGLVQNALNWAGEDPTAAATIGASAALAPLTGGASLAARIAATAVPAAIGSVIGAGTEGAEFVERTVNDPNLTEEQKSRALEEGFGTAATTGAAFGGLTIPVGRVAGAATRTLGRTSLTATGRQVAKAATKEEAEAIIERAALEQAAKRATESRAKRIAKSIAENATEAGIINVGDVVAQNVNYNAATGQEGDVLEGAAEAAAASLAMGVPFGILGARRPRTPRGTETPTNTPPAPEAAPTGGSPTGGAPAGAEARPNVLTTDGTIAPGSNAGRYYHTVTRYVQSGGKWNADSIVDNFLRMEGNDLTTLKAWLDDAPGKSKAFTEKRMAELYDAAMRRDPDGQVFAARTAGDVPTMYDKDSFLKRLRAVDAFDDDGFSREVNGLLRQGFDPKVIRDDVKKFRLKAEKKNAVIDILNAHIAQREAEARSGKQGSDGTRGDGAAASVLAGDGQGRTGTPDLSNRQGDSRMATDSRSIAETLADAGATELSGNSGAVESGRLGRATEQNLGPGEAPDANAAPAGNPAAAGTDGGPSAGAAAPRVPQPDTGAGSAGGADIGSAGGTERAGDVGGTQSLMDEAMAMFNEAARERLYTDAPAVAGRIESLQSNLNAPQKKAFYKAMREGANPDNLAWARTRDAMASTTGMSPNTIDAFVNDVSRQYKTAKSLGADVVLDDLVKANASEADTIKKVYSNLWCLTR